MLDRPFEFAEDFCVCEFPVFDDRDAGGWNVGFLQPAGKLFLKSEIYRCGLGLCMSSLNGSHENDEEQTQ